MVSPEGHKGREIMGAATAIPLAFGALGAFQQQKQAGEARKQGKAYAADMAQQRAANAKIQAKLDKDLKKSQARTAVGLARAGRGRRSGSLFGDNSPGTAAPTSNVLGG